MAIDMAHAVLNLIILAAAFQMLDQRALERRQVIGVQARLEVAQHRRARTPAPGRTASWRWVWWTSSVFRFQSTTPAHWPSTPAPVALHFCSRPDWRSPAPGCAGRCGLPARFESHAIRLRLDGAVDFLGELVIEPVAAASSLLQVLDQCLILEARTSRAPPIEDRSRNATRDADTRRRHATPTRDADTRRRHATPTRDADTRRRHATPTRDADTRDLCRIKLSRVCVARFFQNSCNNSHSRASKRWRETSYRRSRSVIGVERFSLVRRGGKRTGAGRNPKGRRAQVTHVARPALSSSRHPGRRSTAPAARGCPSLRGPEVRAGNLLLPLLPAPIVVGFGSSLIEPRRITCIDRRRARCDGPLAWAPGPPRQDRASLEQALASQRQGLRRSLHAQILRENGAVRNALVYTLQNARKHGVLVDGPDPYTSGPWFDGWRTDRIGTDPIAVRASSTRSGSNAAGLGPRPTPGAKKRRGFSRPAGDSSGSSVCAKDRRCGVPVAVPTRPRR